MDPELEHFISHLGEDEPFPGNQQMNELWKELEEYFDNEFLDIDKFLDELLPNAQPVHPVMEEDIQVPKASAQLSTEEFIKSFAIPDSFYNDLIPDPKLDFKNMNLVPSQMLLKSVQSRRTMINSLNSNHLSNEVPSFVAPLQNYVSDIVEKKSKPSQESNINWYKVLEGIQLYPGITVDSIVENIICDSTIVRMLPSKEEIFACVTSLFSALNNYIDRLTAEFANQQFFDAMQLDNMSLKHRNEVISLSDIQANSLLDILSKWMRVFTEKFVHINQQRRHVEEKVSKKIIEKIVEMYKTKLKSIPRKKEFVSQGIRRVYLNCGVDFNTYVLRELEKRLEEVNSTPEQTVSSPTSEKSGISHQETHDLHDSNVEIKLLVSEYVSNVKQKALQCAGISTLQQFDDVNKNCLADITQKFDRKMIEVPAAQRNDIKKEFIIRLESESNSNRSEFKTNKSSVSSEITSPCTLTRSHSVGIHFGFENLSVSYFNDVSNNFRNIYGPTANLVSFAPQGIFIGQISNTIEYKQILNMEKLLNTLNVDTTYDTLYHGKLKLEAIIALVFMQIDEIVKQNLHTATRIKYVVAIPSCLNGVMQNIFKCAMNIGNIEGNLVREPCALTAQFTHEHHQFATKANDEFLITLFEDSQKACDSVIYKITGKNGRIIEISSIGGSEATSFVGFFPKRGIEIELEKVKRIMDNRNRFLICCPSPEITKQIKNQFSKSKVHSLKFDSRKLADGAAVLSSIANGNSKFECSFDLSHLTSIKPLPGHSNEVYRLKHYGYKHDHHLDQISTKLHSLIEKQSQDFAKCKASTKQLLMGKMKDLEESHLPEPKKRDYRKKLENTLKTVEEEYMSELVIKDKADPWMNQVF